jgi:hypothetical protein
MARRPQGTVRKSPRLKQGKPKPPGVGRPSPRPKRSKGPVGGPVPKKRKGLPAVGKALADKFDRNPTVSEFKKFNPKGKAMGGQAQEGGARGALRKKRITARQQELMDMLERLYGGKSKPQPGPTIRRKPKKTDEKKFMDRPILPRDKPKGKPIRPILPRDFKKPKMKRAK